VPAERCADAVFVDQHLLQVVCLDPQPARDAARKRSQKAGFCFIRAPVHDAAARGVVPVTRLHERQSRDLVEQRAFFARRKVIGLVDESRRAGVAAEKLGLVGLHIS